MVVLAFDILYQQFMLKQTKGLTVLHHTSHETPPPLITVDFNIIIFEHLSFLPPQGTVLDRIDFNVEQACVKTEDGLKQLQKVNSKHSFYMHI